SGGSQSPIAQDWGVDTFNAAQMTLRDSTISGGTKSIFDNSSGASLVLNTALNSAAGGPAVGGLTCTNAYDATTLAAFGAHCS
ncbi:MAG TPA: hypothetical protein VGM78_02295, partial [Ilumatobacteraceae bacterium]